MPPTREKVLSRRNLDDVFGPPGNVALVLGGIMFTAILGVYLCYFSKKLLRRKNQRPKKPSSEEHPVGTEGCRTLRSMSVIRHLDNHEQIYRTGQLALVPVRLESPGDEGRARNVSCHELTYTVAGDTVPTDHGPTSTISSSGPGEVASLNSLSSTTPTLYASQLLDVNIPGTSNDYPSIPSQLPSRRSSPISLESVRLSWQPTELDLFCDSSQPISQLDSSKASQVSEPIRTSLSPIQRLSVAALDIASDRPFSLAEFPTPPPRSLSPLRDFTPSTPPVTPCDVWGSGSIRLTPPGPHPGLRDEVGDRNTPPSSDPVQNNGTTEQPPSATSTRPPTYHGSWHQPSPSQYSFSTLPLYPGREDDASDHASVRSRTPSYRSSISMIRSQRPIRRALPPIPVPPLPSSFQHSK